MLFEITEGGLGVFYPTKFLYELSTRRKYPEVSLF